MLPPAYVEGWQSRQERAGEPWGSLLQGRWPAAFQLLAKEEKEAPISHSTGPSPHACTVPADLAEALDAAERCPHQPGNPLEAGVWGPILHLGHFCPRNEALR